MSVNKYALKSFRNEYGLIIHANLIYILTRLDP